jgi:hypothetical protein
MASTTQNFKQIVKTDDVEMKRKFNQMITLVLTTSFAACAFISCEREHQSLPVTSQPDQLETAKSKFEEGIKRIRDSYGLRDWYGKDEHIRYDIKPSDSAIAQYDGIIYLTHFEGEFTASYTYQFSGGRWRFLKSDSSKVQRDVDDLMKAIVY